MPYNSLDLIEAQEASSSDYKDLATSKALIICKSSGLVQIRVRSTLELIRNRISRHWPITYSSRTYTTQDPIAIKESK
jgi:hypothetical protein